MFGVPPGTTRGAVVIRFAPGAVAPFTRAGSMWLYGASDFEDVAIVAAAGIVYLGFSTAGQATICGSAYGGGTTSKDVFLLPLAKATYLNGITVDGISTTGCKPVVLGGTAAESLAGLSLHTTSSTLYVVGNAGAGSGTFTLGPKTVTYGSGGTMFVAAVHTNGTATGGFGLAMSGSDTISGVSVSGDAMYMAGTQVSATFTFGGQMRYRSAAGASDLVMLKANATSYAPRA